MTAVEAMLISWKENTHGRYITLKLPDDNALEPFKSMKTGSANGQRLGVAFAIIADDETEHEVMADASTREKTSFEEMYIQVPEGEYNVRLDENNNFRLIDKSSAAKPKREMTLPQMVGMISGREDFHDYVRKELSNHEAWKEAEDSKTSSFVRAFCGVKSRSEILPDTVAQKNWATLYNSYKAWLSSSIKGEER